MSYLRTLVAKLDCTQISFGIVISRNEISSPHNLPMTVSFKYDPMRKNVNANRERYCMDRMVDNIYGNFVGQW